MPGRAEAERGWWLAAFRFHDSVWLPDDTVLAGVYYGPSMTGFPAETDFIVIGAGIAGLRAAIELASAGKVLLVTKKHLPDFKAPDPKSEAAWLSDEDEVSLHLQDTLTAGDGLCNLEGVKLLLEEAPARIEELIEWGKPVGTTLEFGVDTTSRRSHALHAQGASIARETLRILCVRAQALTNVAIAECVFATEILTDAGHVVGLSVLDEAGTTHAVACGNILLTTGGMGQIYRNTTNSEAATADGVALAFRAGADLGDMEFVQFHPTALHMKKVPRFLLPENLRMEGAYLRNVELNRFMAKYHPEAERAPRNLVVRAIIHEMEVSRSRDPFVYLDLTHLNATKVQKHFPRVYKSFMAHNIDITEDVIPVRPAAHSSIGGVRTDLCGKTNIPGLHAAGEVAASGLHGANRLPSNFFLESLVYGARAGRSMREGMKAAPRLDAQPQAPNSNATVMAGVEDLVGRVQDLMWSDVGVVRTRMGMQKVVKELIEMAPKLEKPTTRRAHEVSHLHLAAILVARSALAREESRGAHYRMDYPDHDDKKFLKHSIVRGDKVLFIA
jgi:L-aspartate oxidase